MAGLLSQSVNKSIKDGLFPKNTQAAHKIILKVQLIAKMNELFLPFIFADALVLIIGLEEWRKS